LDAGHSAADHSFAGALFALILNHNNKERSAMTYTSDATPSVTTVVAPVNDTHQSAVAWAAIFAGAFVMLAITLMLNSFGAGMGFASASPWPGLGVSAATFAIFAAIWLMIVQWVSAGVGGYLTGRLRKRWAGAHTHEAFFRDTAHGFVAWSVATMITAGVIVFAAAGGVAGAAAVLGASGPRDAITDRLLRPQTESSTTAPNAEGRAEVTRLLSGVGAGGMATDDRTYLSRVVAARAGVDQAEADRRVNAALQQVDDARKAATKASFFLFFSLLVGAFIASAAAAYGGSQRDEQEDAYSRGLV
jgi:hypothetical protein